MHFGLFKLGVQPTNLSLQKKRIVLVSWMWIHWQMRCAALNNSIVLCIMEVDLLPANHLQFQECLAGTNIAFCGVKMKFTYIKSAFVKHIAMFASTNFTSVNDMGVEREKGKKVSISDFKFCTI